MIVFFLQIILTIVATVLYYLFGSPPSGFLGILAGIGIALAVFIGYILCYALFVILSVLTLDNSDRKSVWKHRLYNQLAVYLFNVLLRVRIVYSGLENLPTHNRFVTYSNHIEFTDPVYLKRAFNRFPLAYVTKEELFRYPILRNVLNGAGCIPLARGMDRQGLQAILLSIKAVKNEQPMGIFPEGTRSYQNKMIPFKSGAFKLALKAEADIAPVCFYNMHGIFAKHRIRIHTGYVHVLPVIPYSEFKDMDTASISSMVQKQIEDQIRNFESRIPSNDKVSEN